MNNMNNMNNMNDKNNENKLTKKNWVDYFNNWLENIRENNSICEEQCVVSDLTLMNTGKILNRIISMNPDWLENLHITRTYRHSLQIEIEFNVSTKPHYNMPGYYYEIEVYEDRITTVEVKNKYVPIKSIYDLDNAAIYMVNSVRSYLDLIEIQEGDKNNGDKNKTD